MKIIVIKDKESGGFSAGFKNFPYVRGVGKTPPEAVGDLVTVVAERIGRSSGATVEYV
jgi:hypothetical protein